MLEINEATVSYGAARVLYEVSFSVHSKIIACLLGSNGAGKTTLLNTISGIIRPLAGSIFYNEIRIDQLPPHSIVSAGIVQVPEGRMLFPDMTVAENLELGAYNNEARNRYRESLEFVNHLFPIVSQRKNQIAKTLSGGEQQMVAIARGLMALPKLLILDEPSLGLAPIVTEKIFDTLLEINKRGISILLAEQNIHKALGLSAQAFILENGRITLSGSGPELLDNEHIKTAYLGI